MIKRFLKRREYEEYQDSFVRNYIDYIEKHPEYIFYLRHIDKKKSINSGCFSVEVYDVLDNSDYNKLITSIYKLKKDDFNYSVDCNYKKRKLSKIQYIRPLEDHQISSVIASIKFNRDEYIREITILQTLLNNTEIVVKYEIKFKRTFYSYVDYHIFIYNNILKYSSGEYFHTYANKKFWKNPQYKDIINLESVFWGDVLQGIIYTLFYTRLGRTYKLPIVYNETIKRYNFKVQKRLLNPFLMTAYEKSTNDLCG